MMTVTGTLVERPQPTFLIEACLTRFVLPGRIAGDKIRVTATLNASAAEGKIGISQRCSLAPV